MSFAVWMPHGAGTPFEARLRERIDESVHLWSGPDAPVPPKHRVLVTGRPTDAELAASPELEAVIIPWAGVPPSTRELLAARDGLSLHVLHHNAAPTAELAVTLLLAAAKKVVPYDRGLRAGDWTLRYEGDGGMLLDGRTAVVLGHGAIGRRVARALLALGMTVKATRRLAESVTLVQGVEVHPASRAGDLLVEADAIVCCLPDTPETKGLLGETAFARTRPQAVLVNVGRGALIEEAALWSALDEGRLGAAGLDVWWNYPHGEDARTSTPPGRFDWGSRDDVVLSPHRAGHSDHTDVLRAEHLAASLNAAARGESIPDRVDLEAGY
jgi:phosphoglycerate dehydrogenase-like enzyme